MLVLSNIGVGMRVNIINNYSVNNNCRAVNRKEMIISANKTAMQFDTVSFTGKPKLSPEQMQEIMDLKVFNHHIYEYKKGIRTLVLETTKKQYKSTVEERLEKNKIDYVIHDVAGDKINVFFGKKPCVDVIKTLNPNLSQHTPQEDFILGVLLGYDKVEQCSRYLKLKNKPKKNVL